MVTIIGIENKQNLKGETFTALILQDGLTMVQSKSTGRFYATAQKTSITSTFDEQTAKTLIGTKLTGRIEKIPCEPYEYIVKETGEMIILNHTWSYNPNPISMEENVLADNMQFA
jgi:hypothetical protein